MGIQDLKLSRRAALQGFAGFVVAMQLPLGRNPLALAQQAAEPFAPNAFVRVGTDNLVTILIKHIEFGQGPYTGLATLAADEMDADWAQVRAESAPANVALYANTGFGMQGTGGSSAVADSFEKMRRAGAAARAMLVAAAAETWGVPAAEIAVANGIVSHAASGKSSNFGDLAAKAGTMPTIDPASVTLKEASAFTMIGKDIDQGPVKRIDSAAKTNGSAIFTIDIRADNMLTVVVARSPRFGGKVAAFDDSAAKQVRDVVAIKQISSGIAVYAKGMWPALKARDLLKITWDDSAAEGRSSEAIFDEYKALARTAGTVAGTKGDAEAALAGAETVIEAEFVFPYLAHGPMEPLDGFIVWDGTTAKTRFGSQIQTGDQMAIAKVLGIGMENVFIDTMIAGGSFGRRAQGSMHLAVELAEVAKAVDPGTPVKLVWTREDDIRGGYYRPAYVHRLRGGVKDGKIVAWTGTIVGQSIMGGGPMAAAIQNGVDPTSVEGARELPYEIADFRSELHTTESPVSVLWWRSVGHTHTGYAVECFVDELLEAAGKDPVAGRLEMMAAQPRAAGVLQAVAKLANWTGPMAADGRARGVAVVESFGSFVAQIAEVSAGEGGVPKVHKVWCAVDCGIAVNPDVIRAQMEGGIGYGIGHALFAEVTLKDGLVVQGNFDTYRSLRINEMPDVEVTLGPTTETPPGVGEPGLPAVAPAVANAMARLGLGRPKRLPFVGGIV